MYCDRYDEPLEAGLMEGETIGYYDSNSFVNYPKTQSSVRIPPVGFPQIPTFLNHFKQQIGVMLKPQVHFVVPNQTLATAPIEISNHQIVPPKRVYSTGLAYIGMPYMG